MQKDQYNQEDHPFFYGPYLSYFQPLMEAKYGSHAQRNAQDLLLYTDMICTAERKVQDRP